MFGLPVIELSTKARSGIGQWLSEGIATFGLILTILGTVKHRHVWVPPSVAFYIVAAYWFTSSTSFANPAITIARCLSNTFAGIAPAHVPGFIIAQIIGALAAHFAAMALFPNKDAA
jgi:glycerol uptake facilitator-like aquaporin